MTLHPIQCQSKISGSFPPGEHMHRGRPMWPGGSSDNKLHEADGVSTRHSDTRATLECHQVWTTNCPTHRPRPSGETDSSLEFPCSSRLSLNSQHGNGRQPLSGTVHSRAAHVVARGLWPLHSLQSRPDHTATDTQRVATSQADMDVPPAVLRSQVLLCWVSGRGERNNFVHW